MKNKEIIDKKAPNTNFDMLAVDLLRWLKEERNVLQNTDSMMWHKTDEQKKALEVAKSLSQTIQYIELSKIINE